MPKQSKFLLNIVCGAENTTEEIRGKVQCISSGQTVIFTNFNELHKILLTEIQTLSEGLEARQLEKGETSISSGLDQYPVIDYSKEL